MLVLFALAITLLAPQRLVRIVPTTAAASSTVVISQLYGGGGGAGFYMSDYVELFNVSSSAVVLTGFSLQYGSATGNFGSLGTNVYAFPSGTTIQANKYLLVQLSTGGTGAALPVAPDLTTTNLAMSQASGKVALANTAVALGCGATATPCALPHANIVDLVAYGASNNGEGGTTVNNGSALTNQQGGVRKLNGCQDTDNNNADFNVVTGPVPRNSLSPANNCGVGALQIDNASPLPSGTVGVPYSVTFTASGGSGSGYTFAQTAGTLPPGLTLSGAVLSGTPTTAGPFNFTIQVTDSATTTASKVFDLTINAAGTCTTTHTISQIQGSGNASPVSGSVTTTGIVTGVKSNGFFLQMLDPGDANPSTSDGVFVFTSAAPPAGAAVGNSVCVTGTVAEFVPASDPGTPSLTELTSPTVSVISTGNSLPSFHTITAAETQVNDVNNLEKFEGMRVHVDSLTASAPTGGNIDEINARSTSFGDFYGVITGVARPFREPGIEVPYPVPTPYPSGAAPASVPIFDANPERIRVNSLGLVGSVDLQVASNAVVTGITGPLDYGFRTYTIDTDPPSVTATPLMTGGVTLTPVPAPTARELTIGSFNMQRFFDTTDDPTVSDAVLCSPGDPRPACTNPGAFQDRLNKASLTIRNVMNSPDVIGIEEMENLTTLQAVATKINTDAGPGTNYTAYLVEGNDPGGIDVGFLVKTQANSQTRITVNSATQYNKTEQWVDPSDGATKNLNDRPPLVLRASIVQPSGATLSFSVVVNHLRSLGSVTLSTNPGAHTRVKRNLEAASLARLINEMQNGGPNGIRMAPFDDNIVSVGDYNSFQFNDGYDDVMGVVKGTPAPASQVVESSADLNNPDMTDLIDTLPVDQKYSYTFGGNAQALDHTIANPNMMARFSRFAYARMDADFPDSLRNDPNRPERSSDHDTEVAYFAMAIAPTAANGVVSGRLTDPNGVPIAGVIVNLSGTQNRKSITDANGNYRFDAVETNGFYTVRPARANYSFSPASRSFSQLGHTTEATFTGSATAIGVNPIETPEYFVRQQYLDFLGREPDESGFNFWSDQLTSCGSDAGCIERRTINVSAAYFLSIEFQKTGGLVDGLYRASYGRAPRYAEFMPDTAEVAQGVVVGPTDWAGRLAANKDAFVNAWVQRAEFRAAYDGLSNSAFVDTLIVHAGVGFNGGDEVRAALISGLNNNTLMRAAALRQVVENEGFVHAKSNKMFVMMQYFGYLRRDPDESGYQFWLNKLNQFDGNFEQAEMVKAFIVSGEYRNRFK
jgi:predicted extracellular nuclease